MGQRNWQARNSQRRSVHAGWDGVLASFADSTPERLVHWLRGYRRNYTHPLIKLMGVHCVIFWGVQHLSHFKLLFCAGLTCVWRSSLETNVYQKFESDSRALVEIKTGRVVAHRLQTVKLDYAQFDALMIAASISEHRTIFLQCVCRRNF